MEATAELCRAIFSSAGQGILIVNVSGTIVTANAALGEMFGYGEGELDGQPLDCLVPAMQRGGHGQSVTGYFAHPRVRPMGRAMFLTGVRRDGTEFPVEVSLGHAEGAVGPLAIGFVADITERRRLEKIHERDAARLRTLTAQLLTAQQDERRLIARELHDSVTQDLASIGIELGLLRRDFAHQAGTGLPEQLPEKLKDLQDVALRLSEQIRLLSHEFHPGVLEHSGLAAALEVHCQDFQRQTGLAVHLVTRDVPEHIRPEVGIALYRICQEALRNVVRHAQAGRADVLLSGSARADGRLVLRLSVMDDGNGFVIEDVRDGSGLGLLSIEERVRLVEGTLAISSVPGEGTRVTVEVPVEGGVS
jgi:two-component system, NarL family, sensor histidine kinase NreB